MRKFKQYLLRVKTGTRLFSRSIPPAFPRPTIGRFVFPALTLPHQLETRTRYTLSDYWNVDQADDVCWIFVNLGKRLLEISMARMICNEDFENSRNSWNSAQLSCFPSMFQRWIFIRFYYWNFQSLILIIWRIREFRKYEY